MFLKMHCTMAVCLSTNRETEGIREARGGEQGGMIPIEIEPKQFGELDAV